jgi:3-oxoacyl-[acyl-carrier protein] reductase
MAPIAIVTGAARGTGAAVAVGVAGNGMDVAVLDADEAACADTVSRIAALGRRCVAVGTDVTDAGAVDAALSRVCAELGDPVVLLYIAAGAVPGPLCVLSDREWDAAATAPLRGAFVTSRAVLDPMAKNGWGRIVIVVPDDTGEAATAHAYSNRTLRAALDGLTRTLALELGPFGITVNLVSPRWTDPDPAFPVRPAPAEPESGRPVASVVSLLTSEMAATVSGQVLYIGETG